MQNPDPMPTEAQALGALLILLGLLVAYAVAYLVVSSLGGRSKRPKRKRTKEVKTSRPRVEGDYLDELQKQAAREVSPKARPAARASSARSHLEDLLDLDPRRGRDSPEPDPGAVWIDLSIA